MTSGSDSPGYEALGFRFAFRFEGKASVTLANAIDWAFEGLRAASVDDPEHIYRLTSSGPDSVHLRRDDEELSGHVSKLAGMSLLIADVNRQTVASCPGHLALHSGAVSFGAAGLLLPANAGSGKTTLTAALVMAGCDYLTDEAAAIDLSTYMVEPYAKPLSLSPNSQAVLGCPPSEHGPMELIPASWLRPDPWSGPVRPSLIVFPKFQPGAKAELMPVTRGEALVELANNSFNFVDHGGEWLPALRDIVAGCECWRITFGHALDAAELVMGLVT